MTITLDKITKKIPGRVLFEDVTATFVKGKRYGLTGPNGSGKSTLIGIIAGKNEATSGKVYLPERVGILRQNIEDYHDEKVLDVVVQGNKRLWDALQERDALYEKEIDDHVGMRLGELEGIIAEEDGYSAEANAETLLRGMGLPQDFLDRKMGTIPLDMQFKVLLCQALFGDPQALLLDEPTNHLDLEAISWLENFLFNYKGVLIVTSHDRHFLNSVTTDIADIDYETIILYPGNYDAMVDTKTAVRERADQDAKSKEKKIAQLKDFVAKFGAGTRASQVQSRLKEIDRLQPQDQKKSNIARPYIRFIPTDKSAGKIVFRIEDLCKGYGDHEVIKHFSAEIDKGDKIGVIGPNGLGKSTLLKMLAGALEPDKGKIQYGHQVMISYFPQDHRDILDKSEAETAYDWLRNARKGVYDQDIRSAMGKMLFSGDDAFKPLKTLSGGETARLILAYMMMQEHNVLILDEPNNHLDLESVSALSWGLNEYKETVIVACHDRTLIDTVATKIIAFEPGGIRFFQGPYAEYLSRFGHKQV